jgi:isopentenyl-diphosphate delta-isomerase
MIFIPETDERVVLVDRFDNEIGTARKLEVHRTGELHRAFSVFVVNPEGEMLLQQRAFGKYHTGGLWSNTSCGHPRPGEPVSFAAARRLEEEMGFTCALERCYGFVYEADLGSDLSEHEYDHVMVGMFDGTPVPDEAEVRAWKWAHPRMIMEDMNLRGHIYTPWFRIALPTLLDGDGALKPEFYPRSASDSIR